MFYLKYLKAELVRRWSKTLSITLGLAIASAIIIAIVSISNALSTAQKTVLNPLENVGTDIMVSRSVNTENMRDLDETTRDEMMKENRVSTDLSKLGNPGDQFSNDSFSPGTMLTFASDETKKLDSSLVKEYATGLILNVTHQEGKIPAVTATFQTGGERIQVNHEMTDEQRQAMQDAMKKAEDEVRAKGIDPRSEEGRQAVRDAAKNYMPTLSTEITTPERTYTQDVGPISTDIQTENFTVAGVDTSKTNIGLILPTQITTGKYFDGENQIIIGKSYADKKGTKVDDKIKLGEKEFTVVGIVEPKLYTNTADLYLSLSDLQKLAGRDGRINILLVKSTNAKNVEETTTAIQSAFIGATVTNSQQTAKEVTGSLMSAANLTNKFIGLTSLIVVLAAFIIAALLSIISVNKRTREIGTLKAIGWSNFTVIRQLFLENLILGILGAILGIGLGMLIIYILNKYNISLSANIGSSDAGQGFMRRFMGESQGTTANIELKIAHNYTIILIGGLVAMAGAILAGGLASLKSAKLKPQEALRNLE